jgi:hypothetical protein
VSQDNQNNEEQMLHRLAQLQSEHRDLDDVIARISDERPFDQLQIQRLKSGNSV